MCLTGSACFLDTSVFFPTHRQINSTSVSNTTVFFCFLFFFFSFLFSESVTDFLILLTIHINWYICLLFRKISVLVFKENINLREYFCLLILDLPSRWCSCFTSWLNLWTKVIQSTKGNAHMPFYDPDTQFGSLAALCVFSTCGHTPVNHASVVYILQM